MRGNTDIEEQERLLAATVEELEIEGVLARDARPLGAGGLTSGLMIETDDAWVAVESREEWDEWMHRCIDEGRYGEVLCVAEAVSTTLRPDTMMLARSSEGDYELLASRASLRYIVEDRIGREAGDAVGEAAREAERKLLERSRAR